jgi:16S rRNA C1402 N4-methylase RsmH
MNYKYSDRVTRILGYSKEEAIRLNNDYIGPEHLMLGMIRDGESRAIEVLQRRFAINISSLKEVLERTGCSSKKQEAACREMVKKSATRVFQALRIDINHEYEVLYEFMEKLPQALAPGGRAAILTFHSGEDRIVKKAFKSFKQQGLYEAVAEEVVRPGREECRANPRAHSTKLRWAVKMRD